jgi:hypothetical protein
MREPGSIFTASFLSSFTAPQQVYRTAAEHRPLHALDGGSPVLLLCYVCSVPDKRFDSKLLRLLSETIMWLGQTKDSIQFQVFKLSCARYFLGIHGELAV